MSVLKTATRFDAHCHLFNLKYLGEEGAHMLRDAAANEYPHQQYSEGAFPYDPITSIRELKGWLKILGDAGFDTEAEHLQEVLQAGSNIWKDELPMACIPLMMDIYFLFDEPVSAGKSARPLVRKKGSITTWIIDKILGDRVAPYFDSLGFNKERQKLQELVKKNPGKLFPFFAIDPRRTGVIAEIFKGKIVSKQGPFYGIKLYPRLGVHPQCNDLLPLYAWCEQNQIPIITHTDRIGFPPPQVEKLLRYNYADFGNPIHWEPILQKHPNLIIDFAHFGMSEATWSDTVARFIGTYPQVYSDLSCYTSGQVVSDFKAKWWNLPQVAERTMFGTDFDVNVAVSPGLTLSHYYKNFLQEHNPGAFTSEELYQMTVVNPAKFLH